METILRRFVEPLVRLLDPRYAEVVLHAEILNQSPAKIAIELGLSEQMVARRLQPGRRTLLHLVILTLQSPLGE